jgi:regulator of sigma D
MAEDSMVIVASGLGLVTLLVVGLMLGYICIFRQLCCPTTTAADKSTMRWGPFSNKTQEMMQMADVSNTTHIESVSTIEIDRASSACYHKFSTY